MYFHFGGPYKYNFVFFKKDLKMSKLCRDMQAVIFHLVYTQDLLNKQINAAELTCLWGKRTNPRLLHFETCKTNHLNKR